MGNWKGGMKTGRNEGKKGKEEGWKERREQMRRKGKRDGGKERKEGEGTEKRVGSKKRNE